MMKKSKSLKLISILLCGLLVFQQTGFAQVASVELNMAGHLGSRQINIFLEKFRPVHLRYLQYDGLNNNFKLRLDKGDTYNSKTQDLESTTYELLNYFFVGIALPNDSFWVNLRPDLPDKIIDPLLAQTQVGRILLEADLQLKKDTANATNPGTLEGKDYWDKLYKKAGELYGNQNVTIPTLTRPWIVPDEIIIQEAVDSAYIYKVTLKVMLEQDYLKDSANYSFKDPREKQLNEYSSQIIREKILPRLTKDINNAKRYAPLRQVYYSLILAQWFKARNADKNTAYSGLINKKDLSSLSSKTSYSVATYFNAYQENFVKGEYNIQQPVYTLNGQVIRSYFSGGASFKIDFPAPGASVLSTSSGGSVSVLPVLRKSFSQKYLSTIVATFLIGKGVVLKQGNQEVEPVTPASLGSSGEHEPVNSAIRRGYNEYTRLGSTLAAAQAAAQIIVEALSSMSEDYHLDNLQTAIDIIEMAANPQFDWAGLILKKYAGRLDHSGIAIDVQAALKKSDKSAEEKFRTWLKSISAEELSAETQLSGVLNQLLANLQSSGLSLQTEAVKAIKSLVNAGVWDKEMVRTRISLDTLLKSLESSDSYAQISAAWAIQVLAEAGILDREKVKKSIALEPIISNLQSIDPHVQTRVTAAIKALVNAGVLDRDRITENLIKQLRANLESKFSGLLSRTAELIKVLANANLLDKEMLKRRIYLVQLSANLLSKNLSILTSAGEAVKDLAEAGVLDKEKIKKMVLVSQIQDNLESIEADTKIGTAELIANLADAEAWDKETVEKYLADQLFINVQSSFSTVQSATAHAIRALVLAGVLDKETVKRRISLDSLFSNLKNRTGAGLDVAAKAIVDLFLPGVWDKESVKKMISLNSPFFSAEAIKVLADAGLLDKEMVMRTIPLGQFIDDLENKDSSVRAVIIIKALADAKILDQEMVRGNFLKRIIRNLQNNSPGMQLTAATIIKVLANAGVLNKEMVKGSLARQLMINLQSKDLDVQEKTAAAIEALANAGILDKEIFKSKIDLSIVDKIVPDQYRYDYLHLLEILIDDPVAAYQIFGWDSQEVSELSLILDYFAEGLALDPGYIETKLESGRKHSLEKKLIDDILTLSNNPKVFINLLKQKIKTTINDDSVSLAIRVYEIASVNAARGLIAAMGLDKNNVIILYDKEIDAAQAEKFFPGYTIEDFSGFKNREATRVEFHDYGNMRVISSLKTISASLPYTPFKFNLPEGISEKEASLMKQALGIGSRKVIVIGSPSDLEFQEFMQSYNALYGGLLYAQRPLLIVGFRQRRNENELKLLGSLSGQSIAVRTDASATLPNVTDNNVLILNTSGELLNMYALADVAIVGQDRNIFEPASQKAAVLYFEGSWGNNQEAKEALVNLKAALVFSQGNLERLLTFPGEIKEMAKRGLEAVAVYKQEVISKTEQFVLQIIGATDRLRNKLVSADPVSIDQDYIVERKVAAASLGSSGEYEPVNSAIRRGYNEYARLGATLAAAQAAAQIIVEALSSMNEDYHLDNLQTAIDIIEMAANPQFDWAGLILKKYAGRLSHQGIVEDIQAAVGQSGEKSEDRQPKERMEEKFGGIDFRFLPIVTRSLEDLKASLRAMPQVNLQRVNLTREWLDIERLVNSGITPSAERLKDYFAASFFKDNLNSDMIKIVACISDVLRMEEQDCSLTDPALKDILVVLGSGRSAEQLKLAFAN